MMNKRGQVSIFVILGIVLVVIITFIYLIKPVSFGNLQSARTEDVQDYMEDCVKNLVEEGADNEGFKGNAENAEVFLVDYMNENINQCQEEVNEKFSNVEAPNEFSVNAKVEENDYRLYGSQEQDRYVDENGNVVDFYAYKKTEVVVNYAAVVLVDGNRDVLKPILVEYLHD